MLASLTFGDFFERVGETFRVEGPSGAFPLTLVEATDLARRESPRPGRCPFSVIFLGPPTPVLTQGIRALEHATLGRLEIFLVPIGPDAAGMRYEAVFN